MNKLDFNTFEVATPTFDEVAQESRQLETQFDEAAQAERRIAVIHRWDQLRRRLETWSALVNLRFQQDTRNEEYKRQREYLDELSPKLVELEVRMKRKFIRSPHRDELEKAIGSQAFALWEADILTYDPVIEADMVQESKLQAEYTELLAAAQLDFRGEKYNLSAITKFREDADRATRHDAEKVRWQWFADNRPALDRIFTDLVQLPCRRWPENLGSRILSNWATSE